MKLSEALLEMKEKDNLIGVFQELLSHLNTCRTSEARIPIYNSTEEFVDEGYMDEVEDVLKAQVKGLIEERKKILEWEVESGEDRSEAGPGEGPAEAVAEDSA